MSRPQGKKRSLISSDTSQSSSHPSTPSLLQHTAKKTRFVDPDEDPANFAEQVDSALEDSARVKRAIKNEGYESDSTDDGEGVVYSRRKGGDGVEDDIGEDDMFAAAEKATSTTGGGESSGKKEKREKYMRLGDIVGQEFDGRSEDEDSEQSEGEPEDEDDAERRKKAGMGYEMSSFNMREEMEEGKFTADGMYVRTFDPHGQHDRWMEGLSEKEIKLARKRKKEQEKMQQQKQEEEDRELRESGGKEAMEKQLLQLLKKGETVLEALQRLGIRAKKKQVQSKKNLNHGSDSISLDPSTNNTAKSPPTDIELITHLASNLMSLGDTDIYSKTYEELVRDVRRSAIVDQNWVPPSADVKFEYKWDVPGADDSQIFGPFSEEEMHSWFKASYFGPDGDKVKIRPAGGEWAVWVDLFE